jgi:hypothetical protein
MGAHPAKPGDSAKGRAGGVWGGALKHVTSGAKSPPQLHKCRNSPLQGRPPPSPPPRTTCNAGATQERKRVGPGPVLWRAVMAALPPQPSIPKPDPPVSLSVNAEVSPRLNRYLGGETPRY